MGYTFEIGQPKVLKNEYFTMEVEPENIDRIFLTPNSISCSYSRFDEITEHAEFLGYAVEMAGHPGYVLIFESWRNAIHDAIINYEKHFPQSQDSWDCNFNTLLWFKAAINWALDNCKSPIFMNG